MGKSIWVMNHYASNMYFDKGGRHYYFAKYLAQKGYKVTIYCATTIHNTNKSIKTRGKKWTIKTLGDVTYIFVKTSQYQGNGLARVRNIIDFYINLFPASRAAAKERGIPNTILASSVHPLTLAAGLRIAKKMKVPCVCEIRDLWPESIVEYIHISRNNPVIKVLYWLEKRLYEKAEALIFTMCGGRQYIKEKGWENSVSLDKIYHINNGVDLEEFEYNKEHFQIKDNDLEDSQAFKVVYTGSIRKANNLGCLVDCAEILKKEASSIKFLIWGDGNEREKLEIKCRERKLDNIVFKGRVEKKYIPYIVSKADVNLMHGKYTDIMRFGCSPNKLFDYLAAGKTIVTDINPRYNLVEKYHCGVTVEKDTPEIITAALLKLEKEKELLQKKYGRNAKELSKKFDYRVLADKLEKILQNMEKR